MATLLSVSVTLGAAYASGVIKINLNGKQVPTDVAPQMVNNRVMVPISFVSKALGANVAWDSKTQTVSIKSTGILFENVWDETFTADGNNDSLGAFTFAHINNTVQTFMSGMDTGDRQLLEISTSKEMDIDKLSEQHYSMGPTMLSSQIIDMRTIKKNKPDQSPEYQVRVAIQTWLDSPTVDYWDLNVVMTPTVTNKEGFITTEGGKMEYVVKKKVLVKSTPVDSHRVFPGYTFK